MKILKNADCPNSDETDLQLWSTEAFLLPGSIDLRVQDFDFQVLVFDFFPYFLCRNEGYDMRARERSRNGHIHIFWVYNVEQEWFLHLDKFSVSTYNLSPCPKIHIVFVDN